MRLMGVVETFARLAGMGQGRGAAARREDAHSDVFRRFRVALERLAPPARGASRRAVARRF